MDIHKPGRAMAFGMAIGLATGLAGVALGQSAAWREGSDHYQWGWTVLVAGKAVCADPYVRPSEREIECRSPRPPP